MESLKDLVCNIKVDFTHVGFDAQWQQAKFIGRINGQDFDYFCGLALPSEINRKLYCRYNNSKFEGIFRGICDGTIKAAQNIANKNVMLIFNEISKSVVPNAYDFIYCLKFDSEAMNMSFMDWCDGLGYDNDSMKAFATYNTCCENAKKLRIALGNELFNRVMEAQE